MQRHPLEFIGMIAHRAQSEIHPPRGPVIDPGYIQRFARAHEAAGYDRILVAWGSTVTAAFSRRMIAGSVPAGASRASRLAAPG